MWRSEILDQVFVAMSFEDRFKARFDNVIKPAIEDKAFANAHLSAYRVDNSKTGDSILTDIVNGIAHSRLVLADVSVVDKGSRTETPVRNANVMYEVGVALACCQPSEMLLIRDDNEKFLFDVSTIPHKTIEFSNVDRAISEIRDTISDRLSESNLIEDARIRIAAQSVTQDELRLLRVFSERSDDDIVNISNKLGSVSIPDQRGLDRLIAKGCICSASRDANTDAIFYGITPFGRAFSEFVGLGITWKNA